MLAKINTNLGNLYYMTPHHMQLSRLPKQHLINTHCSSKFSLEGLGGDSGG